MRSNENRNVMPNLVHQIFSFLFKPKKSLPIVRTLFEGSTLEGVSVDRFYLYQALIKESMNHYVNHTSLSILQKLADPTTSVFSSVEQ